VDGRIETVDVIGMGQERAAPIVERSSASSAEQLLAWTSTEVGAGYVGR
jgi:hypothetical protein